MSTPSKRKGSSDQRFTVWVGGGEVNYSYLTYLQARNLAEQYISEGYDDVQIGVSDQDDYTI